MDGDHSLMRRRSLKERLGLNGMACCGAAWGLGSTDMSERDEDEESPMDPPTELTDGPPSPTENGPVQPWVRQSPSLSGMNLAAALALEGQFIASLDSNGSGASLGPITSPPRPNNNYERSPTTPDQNAGSAPRTPMRVSLMRLLEEADGYDGETKKGDDRAACDLDTMCCVCMGRKKGAAFIPCGHTFCRICSRELWLSRGSCPLCNRTISEILDIY